jgi:two-component system nitrogen regulation response regulator GlnG
VRVIAATHQNLEERVRQGSFREDLFHRLNVIRLRLPALRERSEDVPALTRYFLQKSAKDLGVEAKRISDSALERLMAFDFPGNVRQLENICHWITVMAPAQVVDGKDLPPELLGESTGSLPEARPVAAAPTPASSGSLEPSPQPVVSNGVDRTPAAAAPAAPVGWLTGLESESRGLLEAGEPEVWDQLTRQFEARLIRTALEVTRGRRIEAAQKLGIGRNTITRKIQELGLDD